MENSHIVKVLNKKLSLSKLRFLTVRAIHADGGDLLVSCQASHGCNGTSRASQKRSLSSQFRGSNTVSSRSKNFKEAILLRIKILFAAVNSHWSCEKCPQQRQAGIIFIWVSSWKRCEVGKTFRHNFSDILKQTLNDILCINNFRDSLILS